jgi:2-C-methyl-D-erythritol 4-phosphate cytidylyltransferase/2-C-methyl-D-erythritol 2,4-cyclodiphosphate synthase
MNSPLPKQYLELAGKPILVHTLEPFTRCSFIDQVLVVVPADLVEETSEKIFPYLPAGVEVTVIGGGTRRQDSVLAGLQAVRDEVEIVLVHDGVRPLVSDALISRCYDRAVQNGAAIAAVPVKDTLKRASAAQVIETTVDRDFLWQAQTPQAARKELLVQAFARARGADVTDEAGLLEMASIPVEIVPGEETNIKITRPEDLELARTLMERRPPQIRIGHGYDAHRFSENRKLVLGGVTIDYHLGLAGHSDADVVTHALCDAILGALGQGDIGRHFPDSDASFKDIDSLILLGRVVQTSRDQGLTIGNCDITIVCQEPRLAPHIGEIRRILALTCDCRADRLNIKATTTEKMGFTGRQEGIGCHAVVLLQDIQ